MSGKSNSKKQTKAKGQAKHKADNDNPEKNPLLHVENKHGFSIETDNLLESSDALIYNDYLNFDLLKDSDHFDLDQLNLDSQIIVILRYFEYLCVAKFTFEYVKPILQSGLNMKDVFQMIKDLW